MKTPTAFLTVCFLLAVSDIQAQFDSARWVHQKDSAWNELTSYSHYVWAFEWDSLFLVRWTSWTCDNIHEREEDRRAREDTYQKKRFEETSAPFQEYSIKRSKSKKTLSDRH